MSVMRRPAQTEFVENSLLLKRSVDPPPIRQDDFTNDHLSGRPALGNLDPLGRLGKLAPLAFALYLITFSVGAAVAFAWQSYGNSTRETASLKAVSLDHDAMRQSLDRIATSVAISQEQMTRRIERSIERGIDQLATGQEQTTREISDLQTFEQYLLDRLTTLPQRPAPSAVSKIALRSPQPPIHPPIQLPPASHPT